MNGCAEIVELLENRESFYMRRNYDGDKAYQREVRARGGRRTEADYKRYKARKSIHSSHFIEYAGTLDFILISILLGYLGVDRFLLGDKGKGILKLITCGGAGIWWIIDIFRMPKLVRDKKDKYYEQYKKNKDLPNNNITLEKPPEISNNQLDIQTDVTKNYEKIIRESKSLIFDSDDSHRILLNTGDSIKVEAVKTNFNVNSDEKFFFAYDDTIRKNFREGFLLTDKNLYFTEKGKNMPLRINEIAELSLKNGSLTRYIIVNNHKISITSLVSEDAAVLFSFLQKSIEFIKDR